MKLTTFILHQIMCSLRSSSLVHSAYRNGALRLPKSGALQITDHKIVILGLNAVAIDLIIQVKAAFKAFKGEFLANGLVIFRLAFFLLLEADGQLAIIYSDLEVFLVTPGSAEFYMIGISSLMDIDWGKT
jgi:hypothetical protein